MLIARVGAEMGEAMNFLEMDDERILGIVDPIMDNCLNGSNENNHAKHVRDFTERMRNIVTPENLKMQLSHEPRAFFTNREFVHLFRRQSSIGVVWKQYISTNNDELMNQAIFVEKDWEILIDHCMVC
jgi:hypothetical protein